MKRTAHPADAVDVVVAVTGSAIKLTYTKKKKRNIPERGPDRDLNRDRERASPSLLSSGILRGPHTFSTACAFRWFRDAGPPYSRASRPVWRLVPSSRDGRPCGLISLSIWAIEWH